MYLQARPGYSIYFPFVYNECSFYRLTGSMCQHNNRAHKSLFGCIWRKHLDAFWSCTQETLHPLPHIFYEEGTTYQNLGFQIFPKLTVPFPTYYNGRLRAALGVLTRLSCLGKYESKLKFHPLKRLG